MCMSLRLLMPNMGCRPPEAFISVSSRGARLTRQFARVASQTPLLMSHFLLHRARAPPQRLNPHPHSHTIMATSMSRAALAAMLVIAVFAGVCAVLIF